MFYQQNEHLQIFHNRKIAFKPHLHRETEIIFLLDGHADVTTDGQKFRLSPGDMAVIFPYQIHSYTTDEPIEVGKFIFDASPVLKDGKYIGMRPRSGHLSAEQVKEEGLDALCAELLRRSESLSFTVKKAYLQLLAARAFSLCEPIAAHGTSSVLADILEYCQTNCDGKLTLEQIARGIHVSRSTVSHVLNKELGMSFCTYVRSLRLEKAVELLESDDELSVTEIAYRSGFQSLRSFHRAFIDTFGISPQSYRKENGAVNTCFE